MAGAERHRPAAAREAAGHRVGRMDVADVPRQLLDGLRRIVAMHQERPGHQIAGERSLRQTGHDPHEVVRPGASRFRAERRSHAVAPRTEVGQHIDEQPPLRIGLRLLIRRRRRHVTKVIEDDRGAEIVGEFKRPLRGGDPILKPVGIGVAATGAKRHRRHHEPLVVEPLADLPQARL